MKLSNYENLEEKVKSMGMNIGCYQQQLESLPEEAINKVLEQVEYGSCDVQVVLNNQPFVVEVYHVDNEVDFELISAEDYANQYGRAVGE